MAIKPPVLPENLPEVWIEGIIEEAREGVTGRAFMGGAMENAAADVMDFSRCRFEGVKFGECDIERVYFTDCHFVNCDLSGFILREGLVRRASFERCRMVGTHFDRMSLRDVAFDECQMDYAGFAECRIQDARLRRCRARRAVFHSCEQKGLALESCDLTEFELIATRLDNVDLTTCELDGLRAAIELFHGATIDLRQTPELLALCGVKVRL